MRFMGRMVRMPPGGVYVRDTQLSWGDCILDPMQELGGARTGPWELDLRREKPFELVLRVPVGAALAHRALREAAGEPVDDAFARGRDDDDERVFAPADVKRESRVKGKGVNRLANAEGPSAARASDDSGASGDGSRDASERSGSRRRHHDEHIFATSVKDLSNRALHPGRTDPKGMAALLRSYGAIKDDAACSLVDVGSGDGHFALGLARAFPNAGVCGIEAQKDLYEESLRVAGRDCNFIHGLAEKELARCASARGRHRHHAQLRRRLGGEHRARRRASSRRDAPRGGRELALHASLQGRGGAVLLLRAARLGGGAHALGELAPHLLALPARRALGAESRQRRARL
jgi:hypothetical protein